MNEPPFIRRAREVVELGTPVKILDSNDRKAVVVPFLRPKAVADNATAVANDDADAFTVVPGIGKRTAQKLVLELRPKLAAMESEVVGSSSRSGQVRLALESLGFTGSEIAEALQHVDRDADVGEQVRQALKVRDNRS